MNFTENRDDYREKNDRYYTRNMRFNLAFSVIFLVVVVVMAFLSSSGSQVTAHFGESEVTFSYPDEEDIVISYDKIKSIALSETEDYGAPSGGLDTGTFAYGTFHNDKYGDYAAALSLSVKKAILIETDDTLYIANFGTDSLTEETCRSFLSHLAENGYSVETGGITP